MRFILFAFALFACSTEPAKFSPDETAVLGNWAGNFTVDTVLLTVRLSNMESRRYTNETDAGGLLLQREAGTWTAAGGRYISRSTTCEKANTPGGALYLVACGAPDTLGINIAGDVWNVNFLSGGTVYTITLRKL